MIADKKRATRPRRKRHKARTRRVNWRRYEQEKGRLQRAGLTAAEYERALDRLTQQFGL